MSTNKPSSLPTEVFEGLVPALVDLVAAIHRDDEPINVHKQSVCQATNIFKQRMASAKEITDNLPGGEMSPSDQDEVIAMLKALRDQKRRQLEEFSNQRAIASTSSPNMIMEEGL